MDNEKDVARIYKTTNIGSITPYHLFANAIIIQAAQDYRDALEKQDNYNIRKIEIFFYSDFFMVLTDIEPNAILNRLRKGNCLKRMTHIYSTE